MKMLLDSFIFLNFNYCAPVWHFCSIALSQKTEKIQERALRLLYHDSYYIKQSSQSDLQQWQTQALYKNCLYQQIIELD